MKPRVRTLLAGFALIALSSSAATLSPVAGAGDKPAAGEKARADAARPPELKVLDRWVGRWEFEVTTKVAELPEPIKGKLTGTTAWDLNGRFLRCDAKGRSTVGGREGDDAFMWIATYDVQRREYRSWVFWSAAGTDDAPAGAWGGNPVSSGTWDEAKKTLTTTMNDKETGHTAVGATRWTDDDHHEFTNTVKNGAGEVVMEQSGKATRRK